MSYDEQIEAIPDPGRTMEGLRDTGYSFETAVADLIDNSIAADAKVIDVRVEWIFAETSGCQLQMMVAEWISKLSCVQCGMGRHDARILQASASMASA